MTHKENKDLSHKAVHDLYYKYLEACCGYYIFNYSIMTDTEFDELAKKCLKVRRKHKTIFHSHIMPKHLKAATYSEDPKDYPDYFKNLFDFVK